MTIRITPLKFNRSPIKAVVFWKTLFGFRRPIFRGRTVKFSGVYSILSRGDLELNLHFLLLLLMEEILHHLISVKLYGKIILHINQVSIGV